MSKVKREFLVWMQKMLRVLLAWVGLQLGELAQEAIVVPEAEPQIFGGIMILVSIAAILIGGIYLTTVALSGSGAATALVTQTLGA